MNEKLSAFIDNELGELEERRMLAELDRNEELRATWGRFHLIRAAMRNELEGSERTDVAAAVAGVLAREAPQTPSRSLTRTFGKAIGGLAIAASVATVAVIGMRSPVTPQNEAASIATAPVVAAPVIPASSGMLSKSTNGPVAADALNAYLLEHNEFAGMGNMLPYVRTVNRDNNQSK